MVKTPFVVILALTAALPLGTAKATADGCSGPLYDRLAQSAKAGYDRAVQSHAQRTRELIYGQGSSGSGSPLENCLEKYKNFDIAGSLGLPSINFDSMMKRVEQGACNAIDSAYNQITRPVSGSVVLPGAGASASLGLPSASQIGRQGVNVYGREPGIVQQGLSQAQGAAQQAIRGVSR